MIYMKHLDGPRDDGSIIREVTDGAVFVKAIFSSEALTEMFSEEESTQPEWYSALLVVKKYSVSFDVQNCLERSEFVLKIDSASIWDLQQGFYLKYRVTDCMDNVDVKALANEMFESCRMPQHSRDDSMDCSISLTQLMDNMSCVESQSQSVQKDTDDGALELNLVFEIEEALIPKDQETILDNIEEWKPDFVPSIDECSQQSPPTSQEIVQKINNEIVQGKIENEETEKRCVLQHDQKTSNSGDNVISSGESIKLSCSDSSEDDVRCHGDDLLHNENSKVSSSSAGDSQQEVKAIESEQHMEKRTNDGIQKHFESSALHDASVSSTVLCFGETQPFILNSFPSSEPFSPNNNDPLLSNYSIGSNNLSESHAMKTTSINIITTCSKVSCDKQEEGLISSNNMIASCNKVSCDKQEEGLINSNESVIDDTPEDERLKTINMNKDIFLSQQYNLEGQRSKLVKKTEESIVPENEREKLICKSTEVERLECAEEMRLSKLSVISDDLASPEQLPNDLINTQKSLGDSSQFQESVSDQTLLEISSGQMRQAVDSSRLRHSEENDMKTNDKNSFENNKGGIQGMQNNKSLSLDKVIPGSAQKSLKRNRCHIQETNESTRKYRKSADGSKQVAVCDQNQNKEMDVDQILTENHDILCLQSQSKDEMLEKEVDNDNQSISIRVADENSQSNGEDLPYSESLLDQWSSLKDKLRSPSKKTFKEMDDVVIILSSGESDCQNIPSQHKEAVPVVESHINSSDSVELLHDRQRNPLTESDGTKTSSSSDNSQAIKRQFRLKHPPNNEIEGIGTEDKRTKSTQEETLKGSRSNRDYDKCSKLTTLVGGIFCEPSTSKHKPYKITKTKGNSENILEQDFIENKLKSALNAISEIVENRSMKSVSDCIMGENRPITSTSLDDFNHDLENENQTKYIQTSNYDVTFQESQSVLGQNSNNKRSRESKKCLAKSHQTNFTKMNKFIMDIKPKTEIGKKLLTTTVPTDMVLSAFNYYRNK